MLGIEADTSGADKFTDSLKKVGTVATAVFAALKTVTLAAWGFFDSTIRRAEELSKVNDDSIEITKEQVEMSKKYQEGMGKLGKIIEETKIKIAFGFLPTMLKMVETYNEFLDANKDLIANGITKLLEVVSWLNQVFSNTFRFITMLIKNTVGWKGALYIVAAAFIYLRRAMLLAFITNPITWVIAAIGVLMLLIDDFMTYLDGGQSQFGDFWGAMLVWIERVKPSLQAIWDLLILGMSYLIEFGAFVAKYLGGAFIDVVEVIAAALALIVGLFSGNTELIKAAWDGVVENLLSAFTNFAMLFEPLAQLLVSIMRDVWNDIVSNVKERIDLVTNAVKAGVSAIGAALSNVFEIVTSPFRAAFDWISDKFSGIGRLIGGAVSGLSSLGSGAAAVSNTSTRSTVNNISMPVSVTASNTNQAAKAFEKAGSNAINRALLNQGSGNTV